MPVERRLAFTALTLVTALGACGKATDTPKAVPAAKVENARPESDLTSVTLTEKAEQRLGVRLVPVERKAVGRVRAVGGDTVVPPGRAIVVTAPVAGTVVASPAGLPRAGSRVRKGQSILRLVALPPAADLAAAQIRVDASRKRAARAKQLLTAGAGSQRAADDADAELAMAEASLAAARPHFGGAETSGALPVESPQGGILRDILVGPGQSVAAGAVLFQVDDADPIWVRVPIYVGRLGDVDPAKPVRVRALAAGADQPAREATPIAAPPTANAQAATTDLFYQLTNADGALRPGEKVSVELPLRGQEESLVVPWAAVLHDIHGGAWVYENTAPHVFVRRRVEVRYVSGDLAVLARGPAAGARVVSDGAAEIFGTEFGTGK